MAMQWGNALCDMIMKAERAIIGILETKKNLTGFMMSKL